MEINVEKKGDVTLIFIAGKLDTTTATELETRLNQAIEQGISNAVISLKELVYISSAGLRVVLAFAKKLHSDNSKLYFAELDGNVKGVFEISGFYSLFKVYETIEEAVSMIESAK